MGEWGEVDQQRSEHSIRCDRNLATILTSNEGFTEWGEVFGGNPVLASATLDRLLHRCTVLYGPQHPR